MPSAVLDHSQEACETLQNTATVRTVGSIQQCCSITVQADQYPRLELSRGLGNEPALQGLLRVYKDYYPEIILGSASTSRKSFAPVSSLQICVMLDAKRGLSCKATAPRVTPLTFTDCIAT